MNFKRGSEWRKWDLHIHAPSKYTCSKNDCYEGQNLEEKQENFIKELSKIKDIKVLGITDYFSLEGYKYVISKKEELLNFDLIIPNIELRISPVTGDNRKINLHIIPNTEILNIEDIERFLNKFEMTTNNFTCSERHLIEYGKFLGESTSIEASFKKGLDEFVITYEKFFEVLNNESPIFKENVLIGVSNNSTDGASGIKDISGVRQIIYSGVDFIFSGQPSDRDYFLGYKVDTKEQIIEKYGKLLPCLHGSDFHGGKNGKIACTPDKKRFCWIKADTTFEGLKQIIFEPEDRVKIQENKPEDKSDYQIIDSINLNGKDWQQEILLNPNLNTIIGGRSTGKSTLLASIAKKIGIEEDEISKDKKEFMKELQGSISIKWKDDENTTNRDIDFFWQNYMYNIAKDSNKVDELVEQIIKNREENKLLQEYFKFSDGNKDSIERNINLIFKVQTELDTQKYELKEIGNKSGIKKEIEKLEKEIEVINEGQEDKSSILEKYAEYNELISSLINDSDRLKKDIDELNLQKNKDIFSNDVIYKFNSLSDELRISITTYFEKLKEDTTNKWKIEIDENIKRLENIIVEKSKKIEEIKIEDIYLKGKDLIEKNKAYEEIQNKLKEQREKLKNITEIEKGIKIKVNQILELKDKILKENLKYKEELIKLQKEFNIESDGINFKIKEKFLKNDLETFLRDRFNLQGNEKQKYINDFVETFQTENKIEDFLNKALNKEFDFKTTYRNKEVTVTSELISENWYKVSFDLSYQDDIFYKMSQGKQAFVILKLLLEFSDKKCPILIDQPEDSLDNRAIYNELVQYIKTKKKDRQIILVTHNPNIVVGADAEQVIVANQHGENSKNNNGIKFQYITGSLENTKELDVNNQIILESQGIREHVCDILEGGNIAFKKREEKYNIK